MIQTSMPPPAAPPFQHHGGGGGGGGPVPHFRGFTPVVYNGKPTMNQEEYDGKRLRKSSMRKTVDYNCSIMKYIEVSRTVLCKQHAGAYSYSIVVIL